MDSANAAPRDDVEELSVELIPSSEDRSVQTFMTHLQDRLLLKQYNLSIRRVGMYLYVATLAMAQKSEQLIKVIIILFVVTVGLPSAKSRSFNVTLHAQ
jgi:hypothetical protein